MSIKHTIRQKTGTIEVNLTPRKAIKAHCDECMGWTRGEVERCTAPLCPLYPFRLGDAHAKSANERARIAERGKKSTFGKKTTTAMG